MRVGLTDTMFICEAADGVAPGGRLQEPHQRVQHPVIHLLPRPRAPAIKQAGVCEQPRLLDLEGQA